MNRLSFAPASYAAAVSTDTEFTTITSGLYVGGAGNVSVVMDGGGTVVFNSVPAGTILPIRVRRVNATGTTATNIVRLWQ